MMPIQQAAPRIAEVYDPHLRFRRQLPGELDRIEEVLNRSASQDNLTQSIRRWHTAFRTASRVRGANLEEVFRAFLQQLHDTLTDPLLYEGPNEVTRFMVNWIQTFVPDFPIQLIESWDQRIREIPPPPVNHLQERIRRIQQRQRPAPRGDEIVAGITRRVDEQIERMDQAAAAHEEAANRRLDDLAQRDQVLVQRINAEIETLNQDIANREEQIREFDQQLDRLDETLDEAKVANLQLQKAIQQLIIDNNEEKKSKIGKIVGSVLAVAACIAICYLSGGSAGAAPMKGGAKIMFSF